MYLTEIHIINENHSLFNECDNLCFKSKNLYNKANYIVRQTYIQSLKDKDAGLTTLTTYLNYNKINRQLIDDNDFDYRELPSKVANQTLILLDKNYTSYFNGLKKYKTNPKSFTGKPRIPNYLDKKGRYVVTYELGAISKTELKNGFIKLSKTTIKLPFINKQYDLKMVRIVPCNKYIR